MIGAVDLLLGHKQSLSEKGIVLFHACLNDVFYIASAVKDKDDADIFLAVINQIIDDEIINRKKAHSHGIPWFPFDGCMSFGKEVKGADGCTYPVHLSLGVLWSELLESNIRIDGSQVIECFRGIDDLINVYVKGLQITKVDLNDQILPGAKFALYRTARTGETSDLMTIEEGQYYKVADLDTSTTGIAIQEQIEQLNEDEQYYLVETQAPPGYIMLAPIPVNLLLSDVFTPKPGTATQTIKPESGIYDWVQNASLILDLESGVKRTDSDNTVDLTHSVSANAENEIIYYRVTNNPGATLPNTGGPGTDLIYLLGIMLIGIAGMGLMMKRRREAA